MINQNLQLIQQAKEAYALYWELVMSDFKNKELAKLLNLHSSAFSSLFNKVLKPLSKLPEEEPGLTAMIHQLFDTVNNVSETKTRQRLPGYIELLKNTKIESKGNSTEKLKHYIENLIDYSPQKIMQRLEGIYHCYYLSSFGYKIKREPLMISYSPLNESYVVRKGNNLSHAKYQGFGYISNNHIFTIQIKEADTMTPDNFLAHFHLPPSYSIALNLLKGIAVSMSNSYLPISRKVILYKIADQPKIDLFNKESTQFYESHQAVDNDIINYLRRSKHLMEYLPVTHPIYTAEDLIKEEDQEKDIINTTRKHVSHPEI